MTPEERAAEIEAAEGPKINRLVRAAVALVRDGRMTPQDKGDRILDITDALSRCIVPHTPCVRGCSECCYMATAISGFEARMIGRYIGREPRSLGRENVADARLGEELRDRFTGTACTFLVDGGRCGVYPVRPAACRLHHNLMDDERNCRIQTPAELADGRTRNPTPHINLSIVTATVAAIFVAEDFGDIREFFPPEERC